jgi:cell wall-associated NlpC family hydrolase
VELRPGDILAYRPPKVGDYLVGIYTGNGNFILASQGLKVVTETAAFGSDYGPWFVGGRRYVDDPSAAPLPDEIKTDVANRAVKLALLAMGDNIPRPENIYGGPVRKPRSATARRSRTTRRSGS